jgi:hypothetical protein
MSSSVISANGESAPGSCDLLQERLEDVVELLARLLHAEPHEPEARPRVEDDDEDDPVADELDVDVRLLALVKLSRELVLLEELGHAARRGDVAGGERGQARRVDVVDVAARGDELPVLVDDEDDLGVRVANQAIHDRSGSD